MSRWTINDIKNTGLEHNLHDLERKSTELDNNIPKVIQKVSVEKNSIDWILTIAHRDGKIPKFVKELEFHQVRKFRFDWAIPSMKLAIEYEGIFSKKSGHTTIDGYTKDCEKYNLAQMEGWKVLRYTAINYADFDRDLKVFLKTKKNI